LAADGYTNIEHHPKSLSAPELERAAADAYFIGIRSATQLGRGFFDKRPRLIGVGCFCIGTNQVDLAAAEERGIPVFNAPFSNTRSVAELVLAEIVAAAARHPGAQRRGAPGQVAEDRHGLARGARQDAGNRRLRTHRHAGGGAGRIARNAGGLLRYRDAAGARQRAAALSLDELLEAADVVTLHVPETAATRHMIAGAQLARMKPGARLINASRGTVVEIDALAARLTSGATGRGRHRRLPRRTEERRAGVPLPAARHGQRAAHPARRRQHGGGAGEYRHRGGRAS
jgi:D-3-phosphoglycerate dehydrogenase